ncbi:MAG TPA: nitroreductase family protein [Spirochaetota bacterium]|nr:nitroreductase family protein [Spirochaetota bacterium]HPP04189.1 nitroreductase family protein [Spirochaetota bacterium]
MLFPLIKKRRSIRKYKKIEIEKEKIDILLKSALLSPSSRGINPWEFIVVKDREKLNLLSRSKHGAEFLKNSMLGIVVIADTKKSDVWIEDCSIASTILLLMAEDLGLGACWIQIRNRKNSENREASEYVKSILDIPVHYEVESIISIGYQDEILAPKDEKDMDFNKLHFEKFNNKYEL